MTTLLLQWLEPSGARRVLLYADGGPIRFIWREFVGVGLPIVAILLVVWLLGFFLRPTVMPFINALAPFFIFGCVVAIGITLLYLFGSQVQITTTLVNIGTRSIDGKDVLKYDWESYPINGKSCHVLRLTTRGGVVRVAVAPHLRQHDVEEALATLGLHRA